VKNKILLISLSLTGSIFCTPSKEGFKPSSYSEEIVTSRLKDKAMGSLVGLAMGDALSATSEFRKSLFYIHGEGHFKLQAGKWTDDTSMALCLADSLLAKRGIFDPSDLMTRFWHWFKSGYNSSTGNCFDIGDGIKAALEFFSNTDNPFAGSKGFYSYDNGSIMRLAPAVIIEHKDLNKAVGLAALQCKTTHGSEECIESSRLLAHLLFQLIHIPSSLARLEFNLKDFKTDCASVKELASSTGNWNWKEKTRSNIRPTNGYGMDTLEAAMWSVWKTDNAKDALLLAASLDSDNDTVAAVTGQIAGAIYGFKHLKTIIIEPSFLKKLFRIKNKTWFEKLFEGNKIADRAAQLFELGSLSEEDRELFKPDLPKIHPQKKVWCINGEDGQIAINVRSPKGLRDRFGGSPFRTVFETELETELDETEPDETELYWRHRSGR
jgi:ADP-ribosyl-[dinitrogen reductase] hydrolase